MFSTALVCFVAAICITTVSAQKKYNNQSEVIDDMIDYTFTCMHDLEINTDVCTELLTEDKDHSDKKYDNCKCFGPCVAKKMGTMNQDTGKWNLTRFRELTALMENDVLMDEAKIIDSACQDEVNTHCEAGFAIMKCILKNSPMAQDMAKNFLAAKTAAKNEEKN